MVLSKKWVMQCLLLSLATPVSFSRAELPVPKGATPFTHGQGSVSQTANEMQVQQLSDRAVLEWQSFNIGEDNAVRFQQPDSSSVSLNRVFQGAPSEIRGALTANGNIYLINQNGILFTDTAQINVGGLVASTLDIDDELITEKSIGLAIETGSGEAAFVLKDIIGGKNLDALSENELAALKNAEINIEPGAKLRAAAGGRILIFAPVIKHEGEIETPEGQTILAASEDEIYLATSTDPDLRGLLVEVKTGGDVENLGSVVADKGNITLMGLAVKQSGTLKATTSVDLNGSIRLLARDGAEVETFDATSTADLDSPFWGPLALSDDPAVASVDIVNGKKIPVPTNSKGGEVIFSDGSVTEIDLAFEGGKSAVDDQAQPTSFIDVVGESIRLESGSQVKAMSGIVSVTATHDPSISSAGRVPDNDNNGSIVVLESGARIDVSGADTQRPMAQNVLEVEIRGDQLKDSPLQRDGVLQGETIYIDTRDLDTENFDFFDISGAQGQVARNVEERNATGGAVNITSDDLVRFEQGSVIDVSGGVTSFDSGYIEETRLVKGNRSFSIREGDKNVIYDAVLNENESLDSKWGIIRRYRSPIIGGSLGSFVEGFKRGENAGRVSFNQNSLLAAGDVVADVHVGLNQINSAPFGGELRLDFRDFGAQSLTIVGTQAFDEYLFGLTQQTYEERNAAIREKALISSALFSNSTDSFYIGVDGPALVSEGLVMQLDGGGRWALEANSIEFSGKIVNPAGVVSLNAQDAQDANGVADILLSTGAGIDVSGVWANDYLAVEALNARGLDPNNVSWLPRRIDGGDVNISANGSLITSVGSRIRTNASAAVDQLGNFSYGQGGDISLAASNFEDGGDLIFDGEVESFALAGNQGGQLSLSGRGFYIGNELPTTLEIIDLLTLDLETELVPSPASLWDLVSPEALYAKGFSALQIRSGVNGVYFAEGTQVSVPTQINTLVDRTALFNEVETGSDISDWTGFIEATADDQLTFDFSVVAAKSRLTALSPLYAGITLAQGANINLPAGSQLNFTSFNSIQLDGSVHVPGGEVSLNVASSDNRFDPSQAVRLGPESHVNVSGAIASGLPNASGIEASYLYPAGTININAAPGYLLGQAGSMLLADGVAKTVTYQGANGEVQTEAVALPGGSINILVSEGLLYDGGFSLESAMPGAKGGQLLVEMLTTRPQLNDRGQVSGTDIDFDPTILVRSEDNRDVGETLFRSVDIVEALGENEFLDRGVVYLDLNQISPQSSPYDELSLAVSNYLDLDKHTRNASVVFDYTGSLAARTSIHIHAPRFNTPTIGAEVTAPYVVLGTRETTPDQVSEFVASDAGGGTFAVVSELIDLLGSTLFPESKNLKLTANDSIRLKGAQRTDKTSITTAAGDDVDVFLEREAPTGSLIATGDVTFEAGQIYPATLTDFSIELKGETGLFKTEGTGNHYPLLSTQGKVSVNAPSIQHAGVIKAPMGEIELITTGPDGVGALKLDNGSLLSISGENQTSVFGRMGPDGVWLYPLLEQSPLVFNALNTKGIRLESDALDIAKNANVDISGGGDLLTYQWIPGPGGSRDVLASNNPEGAFAILPTYLSNFAPHDHIESAYLDANQTLKVEASGLLPAGEYAVLPARYAMLPGALLLTPNGGPSLEFKPGAKLQDTRGLPIVAGQFGDAGQPLQEDGLWSPFVIEQGVAAFQRSEYAFFSANEHFTTNRLAETDADQGFIPVRPKDAGELSITAFRSLDLAGNIFADMPEGESDAIGGRLDIAAANNFLQGGSVANEMLIVDQVDPGDPRIQIESGFINDLDIDSLLLGGVRSTDDQNKQQIRTEAESIRIKSGVHLAVGEILLAARSSIEFESGSSIEATKSANTLGGQLNLSGPGSFVQVSSGEHYEIRRVNAGSLISETLGLNLLRGAALTGDGAITLESTLTNSLLGDLNTTGTLNLYANQISFASNLAEGANELGSATAGFLLDPNLIIDSGVQRLDLNARSAVLFDTPTQLNLKNLNIDAQEIALSKKAKMTAVEALSSQAGTLDEDTISENMIRVDLNASERLSLSNRFGSVFDSVHVASADVVNGRKDQLVLSANEFELLGHSDVEGAEIQAKGFEQLILSGIQIQGKDGASLTTQGDLNVTANQLSASIGDHLTLVSAGVMRLDTRSDQAVPNEPLSSLGSTISLFGETVLLNSNINAHSGRVEVQSAQDIILGEQAKIDVSGTLFDFFGVERTTDAGEVMFTASEGDLQVSAGAQIGLYTYGETSSLGSLVLSAPKGTYQGSGIGVDLNRKGVDGQGVDQSPNVSQGSIFAEFSAVNEDLINTVTTGGFDSSMVIISREKDLQIGSNQRLKSEEIRLIADDGGINILGSLDASGEEGGEISLFAADYLHLGASSSIAAVGTNGKGGMLRLDVADIDPSLDANLKGIHFSQDPEDVKQTAKINLTGTESGGTLVLSAPYQSNDKNEIYLSDSGVKLSGVEETIVELQVREEANVVDAALLNSVKLSLGLLENGLDTINSQLTGIGAQTTVSVVPNVIISSGENLKVSDDIDLVEWRFGPDDQPGVLTLSALGDVNINQDISDGIVKDKFVSAIITEQETPTNQDSWSYRITAGSRKNSVYYGDLRPHADSGSIIISDGAKIRTGTGDIALFAAKDLVLEDVASAIYTFGKAELKPYVISGEEKQLADSGALNPATLAVDFFRDGLPAEPVTPDFSSGFSFSLTGARLFYTEHGGNVEVALGGSLIGSGIDTLHNAWLFRANNTFDISSSIGDDISGKVNTWGQVYEHVEQLIGTLGGGDISVSAGGDISKIFLAAPVTGKQLSLKTGEVSMLGGGDINVVARGSILDTHHLVDRGSLNIKSGKEIGGQDRGLLVAAGDAVISVEAQGNIDLSAVYQSMMIPISPNQNGTGVTAFLNQLNTVFSHAKQDTVLSLSSLTADVSLGADVSALGNAFAPQFYTKNVDDSFYDVFRLLPEQLYVTALTGNLIQKDSFVTLPSETGHLEFIAGQNIESSLTNTKIRSVFNAADPGLLSTVTSPWLDIDTPTELEILFKNLGLQENTEAIQQQPLHSGLNQNLKWIALAGDIKANGLWELELGKSADIIAGRDVNDMWITVQNNDQDDLSTIIAGRDLLFPSVRDPQRGVITSGQRGKGIYVRGPGALTSISGRNIDLGTSDGVISEGNQKNTALAESGADLRLLAGIASSDARLFLADPENLSVIDQTLEDVLTAGKEDATGYFAESGAVGVDRYNQAIHALFPGAIEALREEGNPQWSGDIGMVLSSVRVLDGGDIQLFAPGGSIDVGLALPPEDPSNNNISAFSEFGIGDKLPSELGIIVQGQGDISAVTQGNINVNGSRIKALDGGSIVLSSTIGDIDAGKGAKTAVSSPPPLISEDENGNIIVEFPPAVAGSGIQAAVSTPGRAPGSVFLFAWNGKVDAGDAGISSAGDVFISAQEVLGADNIDVGGISIGVPTSTAVSVGVADLGSAASSATEAATQAAVGNAEGGDEQGQAAFLTVEIIGLGDD